MKDDAIGRERYGQKKPSNDLTQRTREQLVEMALDLDDDDECVIARVQAFQYLAKHYPDRARELALMILGDPYRMLPPADPTLVEQWTGFLEEHQALAFSALHEVSPVAAADHVVGHAASAPYEVLEAMFEASARDADLLVPLPAQAERAAGVLREVASGLSFDAREAPPQPRCNRAG